MIYIDETFIKDRISQLRTQKGVSARDMSLSIGQNENYINLIENGKNLPSISGLILICEYFNVTLNEFFDTENKNPNDINELINTLKKLKGNEVKYLTAFVNEVIKNSQEK